MASFASFAVDRRKLRRMLPAMSFSTLSRRARRVRELYAELETKRGGRPWTRAELAQGFVGDVGDLLKLLMAKDGRRPAAQLDAKLALEFGDCLWCLLVLAEASGVDLEAAFLGTMDELERRLQPRRVRARRRTRTARTPRARRG